MKIAVLSCANTGNFGDDIIFEGIKRAYSKDAEFVQVVKINKTTLKMINECERLIVGGGELLEGIDILEQVARNDIKIPYEFYAVGIKSEQVIRPYLEKVKPVFWSVRSKKDLEFLHKNGLKNAGYIEDPLFKCPVEKHDTKEGRKIALNMKNHHKNGVFADEMAKELDILIDAGIEIELLALNSVPRREVDYYGEKIYLSDCSDTDLMIGIKNRMKKDIQINAYVNNPLDFLNSISKYKGVVGERLHSVIAAYHSGLDFKVVAYHSKINKFLDTFDLKDKIISATPKAIALTIKEMFDDT